MDLQKLKDLSAKNLENFDKFGDLNERIEEKRNKIKEEIASLEKQLTEIDKEEEEELTKLRKSFQSISESIIPLLNEANEYGYYNIGDLGKVLADLATKITGEKHTFGVRKIDTFAGVDNYGASYTAEEAFLENAEAGIFNKCVAFIKSKAPDANSISRALSDNGCIYGLYTSFSKSDSVMIYDLYNNKYKAAYYPYEKIAYPFITDFLNYVSMYRLNNNLKNINYYQLVSLASSFLEENAEKYKKYNKKDSLVKMKK